MAPARTPAATAPGVRRSGRRHGTRLKRRGRAAATALGLAAYVTVFVTAPAWHQHGHDHVGHAHGPHGGGSTPAVAAEPAGCGHHHGHAHPIAAEGESQTPPADGGHDCRLCELIAQCPLPVAPPAVADLGEPLAETVAAAPPGQRAVSFGVREARGPPRV